MPAHPSYICSNRKLHIQHKCKALSSVTGHHREGRDRKALLCAEYCVQYCVPNAPSRVSSSRSEMERGLYLVDLLFPLTVMIKINYCMSLVILEHRSQNSVGVQLCILMLQYLK